MQRALIQYRNPKNYDLVYEALMKEGRNDLIGFEKHCLIKPRRFAADKAKDGATRMPGGKPSASGQKQTGRGVATGSKQTTHGTKSNTNNTKSVPKKKTIRQVHKKK
jgi:hypothetical protein